MACRIGVARMHELLGRYGLDVVEACFEELLERCARALREVAFPQIPNGSYPFEDFVEVAGVPQEPRDFIRLRVTMVKDDEGVLFDFTGTDAQSAASINIAGDERFYIKYVVSIFRNLVPDTIFNGGAVRAIRCTLPPKGSVLTAKYPASASCRAFTMFKLPELCLGALSIALGGRTPANSETRSVWGIATKNDVGDRVFFRDGLGGGGGGRPDVDGSDALNGNVAGRSRPAEFIEAFYPVVVEQDALGVDSAGAGFHRGGFGCHRIVRFLEPASMHIIDDRMQLQPWGLLGGTAGNGTDYVLNPDTPDEIRFDRKVDSHQLRAGDRLSVRTPGGGGWGDPLKRDPSVVREDVTNGLLSEAAATEEYGVMFADGNVDSVATKACREALRRKRRPLMFFDRGVRFRDRLSEGRITLTTQEIPIGKVA